MTEKSEILTDSARIGFVYFNCCVLFVVTCVWGENACAWSCQTSKSLREIEIQDLVDGKKPGFACLSNSNARNSVRFVSPVRSNGIEKNFSVITNFIPINNFHCFSIQTTIILIKTVYSIILFFVVQNLTMTEYSPTVDYGYRQ